MITLHVSHLSLDFHSYIKITNFTKFLYFSNTRYRFFAVTGEQVLLGSLHTY